MKLRKVIAIVLTMCLCLSFAACQKVATVLTVGEAIKNTQNLDEYSAVMKMDVSMDMQGISVEVPMTVDMQVKQAKAEQPEVYVKAQTSLLGQEVNIEVYQKDGWAYVKMGNVKYKTKAEDLDEEYDFSSQLKDLFKELPEDWFKGVETRKNEDGTRTISLSLSEQQMAEVFGDLAESMGDAEAADITFTQASMTITANSRYITEYVVNYNMKMSVMGVSADATAKASVAFKDPGKAVTITPPEGYESYEEMTPDIGIIGGTEIELGNIL